MNTTSFMKRSEVISYHFMQMPRWLFDDQSYNILSLPAKVAYTFLFNRCQLSQHNGWVNNNDEVYIIFMMVVEKTQSPSISWSSFLRKTCNNNKNFWRNFDEHDA